VSADGSSNGSRPLSFIGAAISSFAVVMLLRLSLSITEAAHPGAITDLVSVAACSVLAYALVFFLILRFYEPLGSIRHVLAVRTTPLVVLILAVLIGAGLAPGASWLTMAVQNRYPLSPEETDLMEKLFSAATMGRRVSLFVVLALVMPACSELFFRGVLFTLLKRGRSAATVVFATSAYQVLGGGIDARGIAPSLLLAITLGWMRRSTGSVLPPLACSIVFFAMEIVPSSFGLASPAWGLPKIAAGIGVALVSMVGIEFLSRRSAHMTSARLADG
jgi:membrane protease YdiL (CAAX protease family)